MGTSTLSFGDGTATSAVTSGDDTGESVDWQDDTTMPTVPSLPPGGGTTSVAKNASEARVRRRPPRRLLDRDPRLHKSCTGGGRLRQQLERLDETAEMVTARDHRLHSSATGRLEAAGRIATAGPRRLDGTAERALNRRTRGLVGSGSIREAMRRQVPVAGATEGGSHATKMNQDWPATATTSKSAMALLAALASDRNNGTAEELATTEDAPKDERRLTDPVVGGGERAGSSAGISEEVARQGPAESTTCEGGGGGVGSMGDVEDMLRPITDATTMGMRSLPTSLYGHANCFKDASAIASQGQVVSKKVSPGSIMRPVRKGQAKNRRTTHSTLNMSNITARKPVDGGDILTAMISAATSREQCLDQDMNFQKSANFKEDDPTIADVGNLMMLRNCSINLRMCQIEKDITTGHDRGGTSSTVDEQSACYVDVDQQKLSILAAMNSDATSLEQCLDQDEIFQKSDNFKEDGPVADFGNLMMLRHCSIDLRKGQIEKHSTTDHDRGGTSSTVDEQSASYVGVDQQQQILSPSPCKNDQGQEVAPPREESSNLNRNNLDASPKDLFSRYLEIKKKAYKGLESLSEELALPGSLPSRNNADVSLTRSSAPSTVGQLLVDWGDPFTEDDEDDYDQEYFSDDRCNNLMSSGPNESPNVEYSAGVNIRGWIAVNPDDVVMRRVSDLTTMGNDSDLNNTNNTITINFNDMAMRRVSELTGCDLDFVEENFP